MAADEDYNSNDEIRQYGQEFEDENRKVAQDLDRALRSKMRENGQSRRSAARLDAAKRLQEKVETAGMQILDLLETAAEGPGRCAALVHELDYLRELINPGHEKNADLYAGRANEDEDEGSEDE